VATLPDAKYGENKDFQQIQQGAPMSAATGPNPPAAGAFGAGGGQPQPNPIPQPVPLSAGSLRPNEPVTAGVDRGAGPGSEIMNLPNAPAPEVGQWRTANDAVRAVASQAGAPPALRALASRLGSAF
jgi:hypothetical protein